MSTGPAGWPRENLEPVVGQDEAKIIDSEYTSWVRAVFKAMPDPQTYKADVEVIIVNDGDQENRSQMIEVWDPKDADEE